MVEAGRWRGGANRVPMGAGERDTVAELTGLKDLLTGTAPSDGEHDSTTKPILMNRWS